MAVTRKRHSSEDDKKKKRLAHPFLMRDVECPVCGAVAKQRSMKTNLFRANDRDDDLRPKNYHWEQEQLAPFHPPFYYAWMCPRCFFAAGRQYYENPLKNCVLPLRKFRDGIRDIYRNNPEVKRIVNKLSVDIDPGAMDPLMAMKLHLLAIFWLEQFEDMYKRDAMNLGRYYLHYAWLFRDLEENEEWQKDYGNDVRSMLKEMKELWPDMADTEIEAMKRAIKYYEVTLQCSEEVGNAVDEMNMLLIVARLCLRMDDLKHAMDVLSAAVNSGTRAKQEIDTMLRSPRAEGGMSETRKSEMTQESFSIRGLIDRCRQMLDSVKVDWVEQETAKAKEVMQNNKGQSKESMRKTLLENGIDQRIVNRLLPEAKEPVKKKGFLSGLFGG